MSLKSPEPDNHFSAFYHDNSLLIQFILVEFVHIHPLTEQLKKLINKHLKKEQQKDFHLIGENFKQIIGPLIDYPPSHHQRSAKGSLSKLKDYCERFSLNSSHREELPLDLHMAAHQALLYAIHTQELLNRAMHQEHLFETAPLKLSLENLLKQFQAVSKFVPRLLSPYLGNENVIFCLLRIKAQLSEIYGTDFLHKRFKAPLKGEELSQFLTQRYTERGFESLLPSIQQVMGIT